MIVIISSEEHHQHGQLCGLCDTETSMRSTHTFASSVTVGISASGCAGAVSSSASTIGRGRGGVGNVCDSHR